MRTLPVTVAVLFLLAGTAAASAPKPRIEWKPIPFGAQRQAETRGYMTRHYGLRRATLVGPHVIVEHYTGAESFTSAWSTFAADTPDTELHELPGTCAQFVVDEDGTVYQLVRLPLACRHTVGLNWTAIGIEHVGTSDAEVLANAAQMRASLELTAWLMSRYDIALRDVIGHAESLTSPYHRELVRSWRCQTHRDWPRTAMNVYRKRLRRLLERERVALGPPPARISPAC